MYFLKSCFFEINVYFIQMGNKNILLKYYWSPYKAVLSVILQFSLSISVRKWIKPFKSTLETFINCQYSVHFIFTAFSSVQLLTCVRLQPHGLQHTRLPCLSPTPGVYSNSCPLSQCCYLTISSTAAPFSFCLQLFLASGSFPVSQFFTSGGWSIEASASVLPMNI